MLQDVEARRQTEVDSLNGGIVGLRAALRRADARARNDLGTRERSGGIVDSSDRRAERLPSRPRTSSAATALIREAMERDGLDAVIVAAPSTPASRAPSATCPGS